MTVPTKEEREAWRDDLRAHAREGRTDGVYERVGILLAALDKVERQRDEDVATLLREVERSGARLTTLEMALSGAQAERDAGQDRQDRLKTERDEARAEVDRLHAFLGADGPIEHALDAHVRLKTYFVKATDDLDTRRAKVVQSFAEARAWVMAGRDFDVTIYAADSSPAREAEKAVDEARAAVDEARAAVDEARAAVDEARAEVERLREALRDDSAMWAERQRAAVADEREACAALCEERAIEHAGCCDGDMADALARAIRGRPAP